MYRFALCSFLEGKDAIRAERTRQISRRRHERHPEYRRLYELKNKDKRAAQRRARYAASKQDADAILDHHIRNQEHSLKRLYGLTLDEYEMMLERQGGVCAICLGEHKGTGKRFHVDHDHETGRVRGLLCGPCNVSLGAFQDSPDVLLRAVDYLRRS